MRILLPQEAYDILDQHTHACWPEEACALLIGKRSEMREISISRVALAKNVAQDRERYFEVDPRVRISLEKELRGKPEELVGLYHSHPEGPAAPSKTDEGMIYEKDLCWLIASGGDVGIREVKGYLPAPETGFTEAELSIGLNGEK